MFSTVYEIPWTLDGVLQESKIGLRLQVEDIDDDMNVLYMKIEGIRGIGGVSGDLDIVLNLNKGKAVEIVLALGGETRNLT